MADTQTILPWRIEGNLPVGVPDPDITVYFGDVFTNNTTGEKVLHNDFTKRMTVKLSNLSTFLKNPVYAPPEPLQAPPPPSPTLGTTSPIPKA